MRCGRSIELAVIGDRWLTQISECSPAASDRFRCIKPPHPEERGSDLIEILFLDNTDRQQASFILDN